MADQRLVMKYGDREVVLAKRTNDTWISAQEPRNDLGEFLNEIVRELEYGSDRPVAELKYEEEAWYCDPIFEVIED